MVAIFYAFLGFVFFLFSSTAHAGYNAQLCKQLDTFECYKVKSGDTWQKLFTDEKQRDLVMRINRINIKLYPGLKIAIPKNLADSDLMDYAPFPLQIDPLGKKTIKVSTHPSIQAWGAYNETGELIHWGPVSGGKGWCADVGRSCTTKNGTFTVYRKLGAYCKSSKFPIPRGGAPMPYCMFFHGGFALHGSYDVPGYNASHGCVRLFIPDAQWLNEEFVMEDDVTVIVSNRI